MRLSDIILPDSTEPGLDHDASRRWFAIDDDWIAEAQFFWQRVYQRPSYLACYVDVWRRDTIRPGCKRSRTYGNSLCDVARIPMPELAPTRGNDAATASEIEEAARQLIADHSAAWEATFLPDAHAASEARLSGSLLSAAAKADARAEEAIADGDPEAAEIALRNAANFRRLATNHRTQAILSGDPADDPVQIIDPPSAISPGEIRAIREAMELTVAQLAEALDVSEMTVYRWEDGDSPVAHPRMLRLALSKLADRLAQR